MNKITKKTAIALVGILVFSLLVGNALFAGEERSGLGLVDAGDSAFITGKWSAGSSSSGAHESKASWDVISAADVEFAASPFNRALIVAGSSDKGSSQNVVNASDLNFVRTGDSGDANLVCVIDGVQVTGKVCVN